MTGMALFRQVFLGFILLFVLSSDWAAAQERITVVDLEKRQVQVPKNPQRIICIGSGALRLVAYLKQTHRVVGIEAFDKRPAEGKAYLHAYPELAKLPAIAPGGPANINKEPDLEAVLKVNPEIIFAAYMEAKVADGLQRKLGIPVVVISYGPFASFDDTVFETLRLMGRIMEASGRAEELISYIQKGREDLLRRVAKLDERKKPRVYIGGLGFRGMQGLDSSDASYTPFEWVRARNVAKELVPKGHIFVDREKLLALNPEIIFVDAGGLGRIREDWQKRPEYYQELKAFREKKTYVLFPYNFYVTNICTALGDAYLVGKILYPESFGDIEPKKKFDEIYSFMLGRPVYAAMEGVYGEVGRTLTLSP